jgi:hypothetical protein
MTIVVVLAGTGAGKARGQLGNSADHVRKALKKRS